MVMIGKQGIQKTVREKSNKDLEEWGGKPIEIPYTEGISSSSIKSELNNNITTEQRRGILSRLLNSKDTLRFLDIHNALSGVLI